MNDLIERLEKAVGPDRNLEVEIAMAVLDHRKDKNYWIWQGSRPKGSPEKRVEEFWRSRCPAYTASLDAAMTLVPEGWSWALFSECNGLAVALGPYGSDAGKKPFARVWTHGTGGSYEGATIPLALCIASLRAREGRS